MPDDFQAKPPRWSQEPPPAYERYSEVNLRKQETPRSGATWLVIVAALIGAGLIAAGLFGLWTGAPMSPAMPATMAAVAAPPPIVNLGDEDVAALEGTWVATAVTIDGDQAAADDVAKVRLAIDRKGFELILPKTQRQGNSWTIKSEIDPRVGRKSTNQIDLVIEGGSRLEGIYEIEGDTMKLCLSQQDEPRPTRFTSDVGSKRILLRLKREE